MGTGPGEGEREPAGAPADIDEMASGRAIVPRQEGPGGGDRFGMQAAIPGF